MDTASDLGTVVSACRTADFAKWQRGSQLLAEMVPAKRYVVVVPDDAVDRFEAARPDARWEIVPDSRYLAIRERLREHLRDGQIKRVGWYFQQFAKIATLVEAGPGVHLIWDADTLPLRPIRFVAADGRIGHFASDERHQPYFDLIRGLFGDERAVDYSFVAQCLALRAEWLAAFVSTLEQRLGGSWVDSIIDRIDPQEPSGFSEYETLGTFAANRYASEMVLIEDDWLRGGQRVYGPASSLSKKGLDRLGQQFAHITFEGRRRPSLGRRLWLRATGMHR